jgi:Fe-S oxidoreductase
MALEDYRGNMQRCTRCSYCKWVLWDHLKSWRFAKGCPSIGFNNFQSYSAGGRLAAALSLLDGRIGYTDGFLDIVYQCQMCGACDVACKICRYDMEPLETLRELRFRLVEDGQLLPVHMYLMENLKKEGTMIPEKVKADRGKWAEGLEVKDLTREKADVAFHAGCRLSYDEELWKVARGAVKMFKKAGVDIGILGKAEDCCGGRAYELGYKGEFIKFAQSNFEAWKNAGVKTVVTSCSDGYWAFKRLYPEAGCTIKVYHTVEYIDHLLKEGKLKLTKPIPKIVTYHDPCHLGRQGEAYAAWKGIEKRILGQMLVHEPKKPRYNGGSGVYDSPRDVLGRIPGLELVEMERIRENAWCCGAGGGVIDAYPDLCSWTVAERIEEARDTGAEAIVTACPWCERNFIDGIDAAGIDMKVYDIVDLVQDAIQEEEG